jgi:hypothetical protein
MILRESNPWFILAYAFAYGLCVLFYGIYDHLYLSRDRNMKAYIEKWVLPMLVEGSSAYEFMCLKQTRAVISNGMDSLKSREIKIGVANRGKSTVVVVFYIGGNGNVVGTQRLCEGFDIF